MREVDAEELLIFTFLGFGVNQQINTKTQLIAERSVTLIGKNLQDGELRLCDTSGILKSFVLGFLFFLLFSAFSSSSGTFFTFKIVLGSHRGERTAGSTIFIELSIRDQ